MFILKIVVRGVVLLAVMMLLSSCASRPENTGKKTATALNNGHLESIKEHIVPNGEGLQTGTYDINTIENPEYRPFVHTHQHGERATFRGEVLTPRGLVPIGQQVVRREMQQVQQQAQGERYANP